MFTLSVVFDHAQIPREDVAASSAESRRMVAFGTVLKKNQVSGETGQRHSTGKNRISFFLNNYLNLGLVAELE